MQQEKARRLKRIRNKKMLAYKRSYDAKKLSSSYQDILYAVINGVKFINMFELSPKMERDELLDFLNEIYYIEGLIKKVKLKDMMNLFPVIKDYDGYKIESKDYWSSKEFTDTMDPNWAIGHNIDNFLSEYYNLNIINFAIKMFLVADRIRKLEGKMGLMEEFASIFDIPTYSFDEDKKLMRNNATGQITNYKPALNTKLKIVK